MPFTAVHMFYSSAHVLFKGIEWMSGGQLQVLADPGCPAVRGRMLCSSSRNCYCYYKSGLNLI
jgi:hypothetical protein